MPLFITQPAHAGYGARIFVKLEDMTLDVMNCLNTLSKWGGADKDDCRGKGWEFGAAEYKSAYMVLYALGFGELDRG